MSISSARSATCREHADAVWKHLGKAERDREKGLLLPLPEPEFSHPERDEQRGMPGQHPEVAVGSRDLDFVDRLVRDGALGSDEFEREM